MLTSRVRLLFSAAVVGSLFLGTARGQGIERDMVWTEVRENLVMSNGDTLYSVRSNGDWWFGVSGGLNASMSLGSLRLPRGSSANTNFLIDFNSGGGFAPYAGLYGEWKVPDNNFGISAQLLLLDTRFTQQDATPINTQGVSFTSDVTVRYISFSPSFRWYPEFLSGVGFHVFGGVDADFMMSSEAKVKQTQDTSTSTINQFRTVALTTEPFRVGGHVGVGFNLLSFEWNRAFRVNMQPVVALHFGTSVANDFASQWNIAHASVGVQFKIGKAKVVEVVRPRDPSYVEPPITIAIGGVETSSVRGDIEVPGFGTTYMIEPTFAFAEFPRVEAEEAPEPVVEAEAPVVVPPSVPPTTATATASSGTAAVAVDEREVARWRTTPRASLTYTSTRSVALAESSRKRLDALAELMKRRSTLQVRIIGHTDNFGSPVETQRVSEQRAQAAKDYLVSKGVSASRILTSGLGSRVPVADNSTEEGRRQNRRIDIEVVGR